MFKIEGSRLDYQETMMYMQVGHFSNVMYQGFAEKCFKVSTYIHWLKNKTKIKGIRVHVIEL